MEIRGVAPPLAHQRERGRDAAEDPDDDEVRFEYAPVGQAAAFLRSHYGPPIAVTEQALRLLLTGVGRYPNWTVAKLDESDFAPYVDALSSFTRRRIWWAAFGYTRRIRPPVLSALLPPPTLPLTKLKHTAETWN